MKQFNLNKPDQLSEDKKASLLQTIKLPKNMKNLSDRLPRPQYEN
jgi:hypothetical protein